MIIYEDIVTTKNPFKLTNGTVIHRFSHIVKGAQIGADCMIGEHCYVGGDVTIGDRTRIQNGNNIWDGMDIQEDVFIGPNCSFTNHHDPSDRFERKSFEIDHTIIEEKAVLSTNVTVIAPCIIGEGSFIGAGSLVLRNIEYKERVMGVIKKPVEWESLESTKALDNIRAKTDDGVHITDPVPAGTPVEIKKKPKKRMGRPPKNESSNTG